MQHRRVMFRDLRQDSAPMLLVLFLLGVQLGPVAHLVSHRSDHTHGLDSAARAHAGAHRDGRAHAHHQADNRRDDPSTPDPAHNSESGHGQWASAHFGLALLGGPPAVSLPPPAERLVPVASAVAQPPSPPDDHVPPVRGPPRLTSC